MLIVDIHIFIYSIYIYIYRVYIYIYTIIMNIYIYICIHFWINYNDLTATSPD